MRRRPNLARSLWIYIREKACPKSTLFGTKTAFATRQVIGTEICNFTIIMHTSSYSIHWHIKRIALMHLVSRGSNRTCSNTLFSVDLTPKSQIPRRVAHVKVGGGRRDIQGMTTRTTPKVWSREHSIRNVLGVFLIWLWHIVNRVYLFEGSFLEWT